MPKKSDPHLVQVLAERNQGFPTRSPLISKLQRLLNRPVVTLYTAFNQPVDLENDDADMLESVLQTMDLSRGLALVISSPGGDGMAAERIINLCRSYSGTGEFIAMVPGKAKSAATLVCFGASKILMGKGSELGPVDPQFITGRKRFSCYEIIDSYEDLFKRAVRTKGNLQPFLLQLQNYDPREIRQHRNFISLSEDIALKNLASGMFAGMKTAAIRSKIKAFLTPETTKAHARAIFRTQVRRCGLIVEDIEPQYDRVANELHIRTGNFVRNHASKCIENEVNSWIAPMTPWAQPEDQ